MSRMNQNGFCSCSREGNIDNSLLKVVVRLGSLVKCNVKLFPLVTHSLYVRRRVESIDEEEIKGSALIICVPDCPGDQDVFRVVEDFCYDLMDEKDISISNVAKLMATSNFLEMESLACRCFNFLETNVFISWKNCLMVLATFDCSGPDVTQDRLFEKCKMALVSHTVVHKLISDSSYSTHITCTRRCDVECLMEIAFVLPPKVAKCIYQYCRKEQFGLAFYLPVGPSETSQYRTGRSCFQIPLCTHFRGDPIIQDELVARFYPLAGSREHGVRWMEVLSQRVPEWPRRLKLILHLAKSMHLENDTMVPMRTICRSRLNWSFLCALLVEATDLWARARKTADLEKEILNLQRLVAQGLGKGKCWRFADSSLQLGTLEVDESDLELVKEFKFRTLLSIVSNFRDLRFEHLTILSFGKILDACLSDHLKRKTFTVKQALSIYLEFPNHARPSHVEMYHILENSVGRRGFSHQEVLDLTKLLDYRKLSDEIVQRLFMQLQCADDPRLQKRFMEMQQLIRSDKEKSEQELIKLRHELYVQTADIMKVQRDKKKNEEELVTLLMRARSDKDKNEEELIKLRNQLLVQTADILKCTLNLGYKVGILYNCAMSLVNEVWISLK